MGMLVKGIKGDEEVMGRFGFKETNLEKQMVVDFANRMEMSGLKLTSKKGKNTR